MLMHLQQLLTVMIMHNGYIHNLNKQMHVDCFATT